MASGSDQANTAPWISSQGKDTRDSVVLLPEKPGVGLFLRWLLLSL